MSCNAELGHDFRLYTMKNNELLAKEVGGFIGHNSVLTF